MIASIMDSYITEREEFLLTRGYQPFDSLFFVKKGSFSCSLDKKEYTVKANSLAIFDRHTPMERHAIEPLSFLYIKFTQKNEGLFPVKSGVFSELSERAIFDLSKLEELSEHRTRVSLELRDHYLNDLLLCLFDVFPVMGKKEKVYSVPSALDGAVEFMKANIENKIGVAEIAADSGISASSLENKFSDLMGTSAYGYLIFLRMERAQRLLTETSLPVGDIASRCGYENMFYFCNAFKKHTGESPTLYRKKSRAQ